MRIADYISRKQVVLLKSKTKKGALPELVRHLQRAERDLPYDPVLAALWEREALFSTRIAPGIAIPHAQIPGMRKTLIAVGKSVDGITYDAHAGGKVHLLFMIVGDPHTHLKALGAVAALLQNRDTAKRLIEAPGRNELLAILEHGGERTGTATVSTLSMALAKQALDLAIQIRAVSLFRGGERIMVL